jgi:pSer/pThr/pTyr-binding forkhead associated (FHA) protein
VGSIFKLIIEDDEGKTTVYPLSSGEISIGRKEGNTIRLMERNVSRRHARLLRNNGAVYIEDLDSYNGIRINGERINGRYEVKEGDLVEIGDYHLALQAAEIEEEANERARLEREREREAAAATLEAPKDEWPLAGTVPDFRLPEEILAGVRGQLAQQKPTISNSRDTIPDTPVQQPAPTPAVYSPSKGSGPANPLVSPPPKGEVEPPRSLPPFPLPGGLPPSNVPFLPSRNVADGKASQKRDPEPMPPTLPINVGPARVSTVPRLVCVSTTYAGREFALTRPELIIGRVEDNDIVIEHRSVSRNHAKVVFDGRVHKIIDLQSANGILVNGEEYAMTDLRKNDLIELGHVRFRFIPPGEAFAPNDDELKEMREAGVTPPSPETSLPPPMRAPDLPSSPPLRATGLPGATPKHDSGEVSPGFDPSTAQTVTDTPLSALTVGLLTPEIQMATLPSADKTEQTRRIEEKRRSEPPSSASTLPPRSSHDQRPTEINIAARTNGHTTQPMEADSAAAVAAAVAAEKKAKARSATEPMPHKPGGHVEVEGRLDPPSKNKRAGVLLAVAIACLAAIVLAIVVLSTNKESPYAATLKKQYEDKLWDDAVKTCEQYGELYADETTRPLCTDAVKKQAAQDNQKKNAVVPAEETVNEKRIDEKDPDVAEEKVPATAQSEEDKRNTLTKKALPVQKDSAKTKSKDQRKNARDVAAKARAALMNGDLSTAEELLKECLKLTELPECYRNLGVVYAQMSDSERSIKFYKKYLELQPNANDADYIRSIIESAPQ